MPCLQHDRVYFLGGFDSLDNEQISIDEDLLECFIEGNKDNYIVYDAYTVLPSISCTVFMCDVKTKVEIVLGCSPNLGWQNCRHEPHFRM